MGLLLEWEKVRSITRIFIGEVLLMKWCFIEVIQYVKITVIKDVGEKRPHKSAGNLSNRIEQKTYETDSTKSEHEEGDSWIQVAA